MPRGDVMYGCCSTEMRQFFTTEEKIQMLEDYKEQLLSEAKGIEERIKEMKKNKE